MKLKRSIDVNAHKTKNAKRECMDFCYINGFDSQLKVKYSYSISQPFNQLREYIRMTLKIKLKSTSQHQN